MDEMGAKRLSTSWFPSPMLDSFSKWGFEMELLVVTACERFHDCGDIFRKASAPVYAGTPAGDLGFACLSLERRLGQALDGRALQGRVTEVQGCACPIALARKGQREEPRNHVCWVPGAEDVLLHSRTGSSLTSSNTTLCPSPVNTKVPIYRRELCAYNPMRWLRFSLPVVSPIFFF